MVKFNWSDTNVLLLIEKVQMHPLIWNSSLPVYKSKLKQAKQNVWKKIVEDMNIEGESDTPFTYGEILTKWRNMKFYFTKEVNRLQGTAESGDGIAETESLENSWKFYHNMLFLQETVEHNLNMRKDDEKARSLFEISDASTKQTKITKTYVKSDTSDTTVNKDKLIDPLETSEENIHWRVCGNILVNLGNLNYLIECIICKHNFRDNEIFIKHVHENHSDIFTEDLKQEFETPTNITVEENSEPYYANSEFEIKLHVNDINTSDCKETTSNEKNFDKISNIENDLQLEISDSYTTVQFKTENVKSEFTSESTSLSISSLNKKIEANQEKKKKSFKRKYNSSVLKDGIPDSLSIPTNDIYQCTQCSNKYIHFTVLRSHFWLKHTYQFKLNDENCVPDLPENSPNPVDNYFHCTACLGRFRTYDGLMSHFIFHPGAKLIENKPLKCSYCNSTFLTMRRLKSHEVVHTRKRPFVCDICSKGFIRRTNLDIHIRIHNNDRRYKCNFCDLSWFTNYEREQHELIHLNSKPYVCEVCGVAYRRKSRLVMHMRRHTGERQGKCNMCAKSFYDNRSLVEHMRIHTGEKKYQCKICQKGFTRRVQLRTHEKIHSEDKNYICKICNTGFKQNAGLYSHMKCVHGQSKSAKAHIE